MGPANGADTRDAYWATEDLDPADTLVAWERLLADHITEMAVAATDTPYWGKWRRYGLGPLELNALTCSAQKVVRSPEMTRRLKNPDFDLLLIRAGSCIIHHCGEKLAADTGDLFLLDNSYPYELQFSEGGSSLALHASGEWLSEWVPTARLPAGKLLGNSRGWSAPLATLMESAFSTGLDQSPVPRAVIADQMGSLLGLIVPREEVHDSRHQSKLVERIKRLMMERFADATLGPGDVAAEFSISKRYVHRLFANAGSTFGATLLEIRLRRAVEMLSKPIGRSQRIGDVAWACGFADASHFARCFKQRFGVAPTAYAAGERPSGA